MKIKQLALIIRVIYTVLKKVNAVTYIIFFFIEFFIVQLLPHTYLNAYCIAAHMHVESYVRTYEYISVHSKVSAII